ncbi:hypothetical protein BHE74_00050773 [Ensete ventricosum]|nr:hypothetical protein BHE74_00050773 [Ensete ventricosum]
MESPDYPPTIRELCEVDGRMGKDKYFVMHIANLPQPEPEGPLKARWLNLAALSWAWTNGELKDLRDSRGQLEDEVLTLARDAEALQSELNLASTKAIADYKESRGFWSGLEKMGHVTYEFR